MTITAGQHDITIYQGRTFKAIFTWKDEAQVPVNLTGYSARLMARASVDATTSYIDLSTSNGGITLGGSAGTITLSMNEAATTLLTIDKGIYDLKITDGLGTSNTLLAGSILLIKRVTV